jgi:hypothetical protein
MWRERGLAAKPKRRLTRDMEEAGWLERDVRSLFEVWELLAMSLVNVIFQWK